MVSLLRPILAAVLLLAGCGAPAIVDASRGIAAARGCEPADLTLTEAPDGYATAGCGATSNSSTPRTVGTSVSSPRMVA